MAGTNEEYKNYFLFNSYVEQGSVDQACALLREHPEISDFLGPTEVREAHNLIAQRDLVEAEFLKNCSFNAYLIMYDVVEQAEGAIKSYNMSKIRHTLGDVSEKSKKFLSEMPEGERNARMD